MVLCLIHNYHAAALVNKTRSQRPPSSSSHHGPFEGTKGGWIEEVWHSSGHLPPLNDGMLAHINSINQNIQFTSEREQGHVIPFWML